MFTFMMVSFAGITVYMLAAAGFITAKGIINVKNAVEAGGKTFTVADIFANAIFRSVPPSRSALAARIELNRVQKYRAVPFGYVWIVLDLEYHLL